MSRRAAVALWLAFLAGCAGIVSQARFTADMSAFLPSLATPMQRLLADQLRDGVASRLILAGIEGAPPDALVTIDRGMVRRLAGAPEFVYLANGEAKLAQADRDFLFAHRYALSAGLRREQFEPAGLQAALEASLQALTSPAGALVRRYLAADPTGEFLRMLAGLDGQARPATREGVWIARDETAALLLAQTRAPGFDIDAQAQAVAAIERAFAAARDEAGIKGARLLLAGPGVFGVRARDAIKADVRRLSALATVLIAALLWAAYRSPQLLGLAFVPVGTGALAGVAAVAATLGTVHAITLGFGITLIGEAVDYAIYLFSQRRAGEAAERSLARIWPTLRLGVLISACSFFAMLFSGFPGLRQLGLFSIAGLVAAAAVTRWVLPGLLGPGAAPAEVDTLARLVPRWPFAPRIRLTAIGVAFLASLAVIAARAPVWDDDLASLSPIAPAALQLDQRLRAALGAPDVRLMLVASGASEDAALAAAETLEGPLRQWLADGAIAGYDTPATWLPSRGTQAARQAALPDADTLRRNLEPAVAASPFQPGLFEPFLRDVAAAKTAPPLGRARLQGTAFALKVDALLAERDGRWYVLLPVRGVADPQSLAQRVAALGRAEVSLLDLKTESSVLLATYRDQALALWALGIGLIVLALYGHLRSPARVVRVLAPIAAAIAATAALVLASGAKLTLFHLVALLLVAGVGSNYALFFDRAPPGEPERRATLFSLVLCTGTTAIAFGLLAWSDTPVLRMIGATVATGALLSFFFATLIARPAAG